MKIKQIAVASDHENGEALYALTEDGKLYERFSRWVPHQYGPDKQIVRKAYVVYWWKLVDLTTSDPGDIVPEVA